MPRIINPVTGKSYDVSEDGREGVRHLRAVKQSGRTAGVSDDDRESDDEKVSFVRAHPRLANVCLVLGVMSATCVIFLGVHELVRGEQVLLIDTQPELHDRHPDSNRGSFLRQTFCRGAKRSVFCD
ncbi:MAG: hypothetical protein KDD44_08215 [Bdellovibrionales bacterium]|nr:hypothetical protein [Bdellovibrionales bacterium]